MVYTSRATNCKEQQSGQNRTEIFKYKSVRTGKVKRREGMAQVHQTDGSEPRAWVSKATHIFPLFIFLS